MMDDDDILEPENGFYEDHYLEQKDCAFTDDYEVEPIGSQHSLNNHNIKEMEEKFQALRKENFSLKFRIYFLEERLEMCNVSPGQRENLSKKNAGLQETIQNLSRELEDSKTLLCAAARALDEADEKSAEREFDLNKKLSELQTDLEREFDMPSECVSSPSTSLSTPRCEDAKPEDNVLNQINKLRLDNNNVIGIIKNCFRKIKQKFYAKLKEGEDRIAELKVQIRQVGKLEQQLTSVSQDCGEISDVLKRKCHRMVEIDREINKLKSSIAHGDCGSATNVVDVKRQHRDAERLKEIAAMLESLQAHQLPVEGKDKRMMKQMLEDVIKLGNGARKLEPPCLAMVDNFYSSDDSTDSHTDDSDAIGDVFDKILNSQHLDDNSDYTEVMRRWNQALDGKSSSSSSNRQLSLLEYTRMMEDHAGGDPKSRNPLQTQSMCFCGKNQIPDTRVCRSDDRMEGGCNDIAKIRHGAAKEDALKRLKESHRKIKKLSKMDDSVQRKESQICCALMSFILSYTHFLMKR